MYDYTVDVYVNMGTATVVPMHLAHLSTYFIGGKSDEVMKFRVKKKRKNIVKVFQPLEDG